MSNVVINSNVLGLVPALGVESPMPDFDTISGEGYKGGPSAFNNDEKDHYRGAVHAPLLFKFIKSKSNDQFDYKHYKSHKTVKKTGTRVNHGNTYQVGHPDFGRVSKETYTYYAEVSIPFETVIEKETVEVHGRYSLNKIKDTVKWDSVIPSIYLNASSGESNYTLYWVYENAMQEDKVSDFHKDGFGDYAAIAVKVRDYKQLLAIISYCDYETFELEQIVKDKFDRLLKDVRSSQDLDQLEWFYNNVPSFYLEKYISSEQLYQDLIELLELDEAWFDEADSAIVNLLKGFVIKKGGMEYLYEKFYADGATVKRIYEQLDGSTISSFHNNEQVPNKTFFASLLNAICHYNGQGYKNIIPKVRFDVTPGNRVDSHVSYGDSYPDKFYLAQENRITIRRYRNIGGYIDGSASQNWQEVPESHWEKPPETEYNLHPLSMVELVVPDSENGKGTTILLAAIMIKDMSYHEEWERIGKNIRLGVNILIIVISAATLVSGPGVLIATLSIIDLGLASADIVIQSFEKEISKLEGGKEFLDAWEKIYLVGGLVTAVPALGAVLRSGAKVLRNAATLPIKVKQQLLAMLKHLITKIDDIPKFIGNEIKIITELSEEFYNGAFIVKLRKLQSEGIIIFKGIEEGASEVQYYISYGRKLISSGDLKQIKKTVDEIFRIKGQALIDKIYDYIILLRREKTLVNTSAKIGEEATPQTIQIGTVKMTQHPDYEKIQTFLRERNITVKEIENVTKDVGYTERIVVDATKKKIRTEKILEVHMEMRFLDLEHEIDHVIQFERNLKNKYCTHLVQERVPRLQTRTINDGNLGFLNSTYKAFLEYEVRIQEVLRLKDRGAPKALMEEHLAGLRDANAEFLKKTKHVSGSKKRKFDRWRDEHFPDFKNFDYNNFTY